MTTITFGIYTLILFALGAVAAVVAPKAIAWGRRLAIRKTDTVPTIHGHHGE